MKIILKFNLVICAINFLVEDAAICKQPKVVVYVDKEESRSQDRSLWNTWCHWRPFRVLSIDYNILLTSYFGIKLYNFLEKVIIAEDIHAKKKSFKKFTWGKLFGSVRPWNIRRAEFMCFCRFSKYAPLVLVRENLTGIFGHGCRYPRKNIFVGKFSHFYSLFDWFVDTELLQYCT